MSRIGKIKRHAEVCETYIDLESGQKQYFGYDYGEKMAELNAIGPFDSPANA